jgi:urocanate hydratase
MLGWDVNNGIARRAWARNPGAEFAIRNAMERNKLLHVTLPQHADDSILDQEFP